MLRRALQFCLFQLLLSGVISPVVQAEEMLEGMDAVKAVIGKPVILKNSDGTSILNFDSTINIRLKRPAPYNDELKGKVSRGMGADKVCLSYGKVIPYTCVQLQLKGDKFVMFHRGGYQIVGEVMQGLAHKPKQVEQAKAAQQGDPVICERLFDIANAALKSGGFDRLVDTKIDPITSEDSGIPGIYYSTVKLGECLIDTTVELQRHVCMIPMAEKSDLTHELYKTMNNHVKLCLGDKVTNSKFNPNIAINATNQKTAYSSYELGEKVKLEVQMGPSGRCLDLPYDTCTEKYGIYVKASVKN